jgi:hypothetical protein
MYRQKGLSEGKVQTRQQEALLLDHLNYNAEEVLDRCQNGHSGIRHHLDRHRYPARLMRLRFLRYPRTFSKLQRQFRLNPIVEQQAWKRRLCA